MYGGRITNEERSAISTYVGAGIAIVLAVVGIYFFFLTQKEKKETTTFDPNRPVPSDAVLKSRLKAEEYEVVRGNGSQTPFQNEFWNNEKTGIYVDVITLEPLFASVDKFDGHIGLPTFTKPISKDALVEVPEILGNFAIIRGFNRRKQQEGYRPWEQNVLRYCWRYSRSVSDSLCARMPAPT